MTVTTIKKSNQYRCPNCGASLVYNPETVSLWCEHCNTDIEIVRDINVRERDFADMQTVSHWSDSDVSGYVCNNCGARTVLSSTAIATTCPYCSSSVVVDEESLGSVRPDTIIPFDVSKNKAKDALEQWRKKRIWAPQDYRKHLEVSSIKGAYMPIWTFDSYTSTSYKARLGNRRTRTVRRNGKTYTETYIVWFDVQGVIEKIFDDVMIRGNNNVDQKDFDRLKPFPQSKYVTYRDEYLAGFMADNYTTPPETAFSTAVSIMRSAIEQDIIAKHCADVSGTIDTDINFVAKSFKYLLAPLYITASKYKNKIYNNYVAGLEQTNKTIKVTGRSPVSPIKVVIASLLAIALIVGLILLAVDSGFVDNFALGIPIPQLPVSQCATETYTNWATNLPTISLTTIVAGCRII